MKTDIFFLRTLSKELRFLKDQEKEKFISEYRLKIDERYKKGEKINKIIASFESPKIIAQSIYHEFGFNVENLERNANARFSLIRWLGAILSTVPQSILFIASIVLIIIGIAVGIIAIPLVVLSWMNFDPLQAIGASLLILGLLPLVALVLVWIGKQSFKFEIVIFNSIWKKLTFKKIKTKKSQIPSSKAKKIVLIIAITFFTILTIGGLIGSFAGEKTIGGASLSGNLLHNQTETLDISKLSNVNQEPIEISYQPLENISWYQFTFIKDRSMNSNIEINRAHNTKETLKLAYKLEKTSNNKYTLNVDMPWNLLIFNISSNKFTIRYDATKVKFI